MPNKTIYLTEQQLTRLILLTEKTLDENNKLVINESNLKNQVKNLLKKGVTTAVIVAALVGYYKMGQKDASEIVHNIQNEIVTQTPIQEPWELIADDVVATVYNAEPRQCNTDICHTASMFRLNLNDVLSHRIIAMERTMMSEFGLKYGDVVRIEGTGKWDGEWQIQDTMNKRFAGQHKIDILIPKSHGLGKWKNVKVYKLSNTAEKDAIKSAMAPQLTKQQAKIQQEKIQNGSLSLS